MTRIIAARFQTSEQADAAAHRLAGQGVAAERISVFYVTPPGQHDATPVGGDEHKSEGLEHAGGGAGSGAAIGLAVGAVGTLVGAAAGLAPPLIAVAAIATATAGAYGGSLAGAMHASHDPGKERIRHAGMMVAVDAGADADEVVATLRAADAHDIEDAEGTWANGTWEDFDATTPPHLVDGPSVRTSNAEAGG
jgi:hypothetical protein